jgi:hypothetical protein
MNKKLNSQFARFSAVYACRSCKRNTRSTGRGDNDGVRLCAECFDLCGEENSMNDTGDLYESPEFVLQLIAAVASKGGNASCWEELKATASLKAQAKAAAQAPEKKVD